MRCVIEFQRVNGVSVQNSGHPNPKVHICRIAYTPRMLQCLHKSFYSHAQLSQLLDCWKIAFFYTIFHHVHPIHAAVSMLFRFSNLRKFRCDIFCTTCNSFERQVGITCFCTTVEVFQSIPPWCFTKESESSVIFNWSIRLMHFQEESKCIQYFGSAFAFK